jgi:EmrB/QacA subfamily drug resistance transporter
LARRWLALAVVFLGQLMIVLDVSVVNVALPSIQHDLGFSQPELAWVVDGYLITFGGFLLLAGRLGDLVGRKRVFLWGLAIFTLASVACGLSSSPGLLIAARFLQGFGGAVSASVTLALIVVEFPSASDRARAMSAYMFVSIAGGSIGLLAGGALTQLLDWHWIFFVNVPIGLTAFLLGRRFIEDSPGLGLRHGVDVAGSILVTVAVMVGVYALVTAADHGWGSAHTLGFGAASLALLAAFLAVQARLENPIMPLRILRMRSLIGSSVVRGLLVVGMFSTFFLGALELEHVHGFDAMQTGLAFMPMTIVVGALSLGLTARLVAAVGAYRVLMAGLAAATAALAILATTGASTAYAPVIAGAYALLGLGMGLAMMPLLTIAVQDVSNSDAGLASGIVNVSMQVSGALGVAALGTIATEHTHALAAAGHHTVEALAGGYRLSYAVAAGAIALGAVVAVGVLRPSRQAEPAEESVREVEAAREAVRV